jgi:hypothetical protein
LTLSTAVLVIITAASLPVSLSVVAVLLMIVASVVFLLSPAMLESQFSHRQSRRMVGEAGGEVVFPWFDNPT